LTIGQYLAPSKSHLPVVRYVPPDEFTMLGAEAMKAGIPKVVSAPLVRSSYRAEEFISL
jgi:lipoic acid synthetase